MRIGVRAASRDPRSPYARDADLLLVCSSVSRRMRARSARDSWRSLPRWSRDADRAETSPTCFSMVCSGLSDVIGSWKMIEMRAPRTSRIWPSGTRSRSRPSKKISPPDAGAASRRVGQQPHDRQRRDRLAESRTSLPADDQRHGLAARDDGETRPRRRRGHEVAPRVARGTRTMTLEDVDGDAVRQRRRSSSRPCHRSDRPARNVFRGSSASRTASPMKISRLSSSGDGEERRQAEPGRLQVGLALRQQLAERRRARRQAEPEEVERRQRRTEPDSLNGRNVSVATMAFGSRCLNMILALDSPSARAARCTRSCGRAGTRRAPRRRDRPS